MPKTVASLSLDLDNKWSYLRTHGVESWQAYPSYLDTVAPRIIDFCAQRDLHITCFVVGRDAKIAYKLIGPITPENIDTVLKREIDKALAASM